MTDFGVKASAEVRVVEREVFMALKINSMRMAGQRDTILKGLLTGLKQRFGKSMSNFEGSTYENCNRV
jgi:hypothetical protein